MILVCCVAKYLTYLLKSTEVIQIWELDNLHMTQCAKIIVGFMANVGNVFYPTFTAVFFLIFSTFFTFSNVFLFNFHLNVYYIYGLYSRTKCVLNDLTHSTQWFNRHLFHAGRRSVVWSILSFGGSHVTAPMAYRLVIIL